MGPEVGLGLPAAGAVMAAALRRHRRAAFACGGALGLAGLLAVLPAAPVAERSVFGLTLPTLARAMLVATGLTLALIVVLAPPAVDRLALLATGLAGLAGLGAAAAAPDPASIAVVIALLGAGHAALPGRRHFPARMRAPALSAVLLGAGALLAHAGGPPLYARLAALAFVLGIVAAAGLVPFLPELEPAEPAAASAIAWTGFFGPTLALAIIVRVQPLLAPAAIPVYGSLLVGLGLLNLVWGALGAWQVEEDTAAWRYSFLADWGLALVGLGVVVTDGLAAAYLVMLSILLVRLPLYLWSRPVLAGRAEKAMGPSNLLLAAALAGAAPFAGFSARVLLLRASTQVYWPLGLVLGLAMLLWLGHCFRLARSVGRPQGRAAVGTVLALAASLVLGVIPALPLAGAGLQ